MNRRVLWVATLLAIVVVVGLGGSVWARIASGDWPLADRPELVHACGRDYGHTDGSAGAGPFTKAYVVAEHAKKIKSWRTLRGEREVWATSPCGTGVFVRTGADRFLGYGLLGGP